MRTVQQGDRVQVHYVKRFQDGSVVKSHDDKPLEMTVGDDHPRLPGLGLALLGLAAGSQTNLNISAERAYGLHDPKRVHRLARTQFPRDLEVGKWVRVLDRRGRRRLVRIVEVRDKVVVVDTNHRRAGQALELHLEILTIHSNRDQPADTHS